MTAEALAATAEFATDNVGSSWVRLVDNTPTRYRVAHLSAAAAMLVAMRTASPSGDNQAMAVISSNSPLLIELVPNVDVWVKRASGSGNARACALLYD